MQETWGCCFWRWGCRNGVPFIPFDVRYHWQSCIQLWFRLFKCRHWDCWGISFDIIWILYALILTLLRLCYISSNLLHFLEQAVYTVLREAEDRSIAPIPFWEIPIWKDISPKLKKVNAALKLVNNTLDDLIAICKVKLVCCKILILLFHLSCYCYSHNVNSSNQLGYEFWDYKLTCLSVKFSVDKKNILDLFAENGWWRRVAVSRGIHEWKRS